MKKQIMKVILLMNTFLLLTGLSLFAQEQYVQVSVPFPFIVKDKTLPAGTYTIRKSDESNSDNYTIRSLDGRISEVFLTEAVQNMREPSKTQLFFDEVGQQHFLSKFFNAGEEIGRQLPKSKAELNLEGMNQMHAEKIVPAHTVMTESQSGSSQHYR